MHKGRIVFAAALATIGFGLSACGSEPAPPKAPPTPPPAAPAPSSEPADDAGAAPVDGEVTAPGTKLKLGERAVLPFEYTKQKKGTIAVTVTAIEKGSEADMAAFGEKAKGMTPYFLKMKVENVGGTDLAHASLKLNGVLEGGSGTGVVLIGDIPGKCDNETAPAKFTTKGASYETCSLSATKDKPVTAVEFDEGDAYQDGPVVWTS
ncbi:hypothetical protein [Amycolatopsis sp. 195334CR]|uniref:hypothetical protein n=1 Tax=Amycolatopsis sp. 195334CR TaxID=2814588 RepID=UPI001A90C8EE|nr:hypothetical protein [Amycolatopsis sp. 195334CR]MBN6042216.1 hypothetical protein [Amycolatopsis sp. 195334CR]